MGNVESCIQYSKSLNILNGCKTSNCDKSHSIRNSINLELIITTIRRVNRFLQSRTWIDNKNTTQVICNRSSISILDFKGDLLGMIFHKGPSTSSGNYTSISVNKIWYLCSFSFLILSTLNRIPTRGQ